MKKILTFVCDIDGVLATPAHGHAYANKKPIKSNIIILRQVKNYGHYIILYSARWKSDRRITKKWLKKYDVPYDKLVLGKPLGDFYHDDRNKTMKEVLEAIEEVK